jgi:hypothetical protein
VKLAIMQPYFLPYLGYWQLIEAVDQFVVYDNIQYTKKGWVNRNRFLQNGTDALFSISLQNDSDYLDVKDRYISDNFNRNKLISQLTNSYAKAPFFATLLPDLRKIVDYDQNNLFKFLLHSINVICERLEIRTEILTSSKIPIDHSLRAEQKVLAICHAQSASTYVNAIGGVDLYDRTTFASAGIELRFIKSNAVQYPQFDNEFVPSLSIIDTMAFNGQAEMRRLLTECELS